VKSKTPLSDANSSTVLFHRAFKCVLVSGLTVILVTFLVSLIALSLLLGSQFTREWLVEDVTPKLFSSSSIRLNINGLNSPKFGFWYFEALTLHINAEKLFSANKLLINFDASALLNRKVDVIEISADKVSLLIPESTSISTNRSSDKDITDVNASSNWQEKLFPVRIQKLALRHVELIEAHLNIPTFEVNGHAQLLWQEGFFISELSLASKKQAATLIHLKATIDEQFSGNVTASIQEPSNAWLGQLLKLPKEQAVDLNLALTTQSDKTNINWVLSSLKMPWQSHKINASGQGYWETSLARFELSQLSLFIDQKQQSLSGWWQDQLFEINAEFNELPIDLAEAFQDYIVGGQITGSVKAKGSISNPDLQTSLQVETRYKDQSVKVDLRGKGNLHTFHIDQALVKLGKATLETSGKILIEAQEFDLNIHHLSGPVRIIETFEIEIPEDLFIDINEAQGFLKGPFATPEYSGVTHAKGRYKDQKFELKSDFKGDIDKVTISNSIASVSNGQIQADGLIDWQQEKLDLKLDADALPLNLLSLFNVELPEDLTTNLSAMGLLTGAFTLPYFKGKISASGQYKKQPLMLSFNTEGDLENLQVDELNANFAEAHLVAMGNIQLEQQMLDITIKEFYAPTRIAEDFNIEMPADLSLNIKVTDATIKGSFNGPNYKGDVTLTGSFNKQVVDISSKIKGDITKLELNDLLVHVSDGELKASGLIDWQHDQLDLILEARNIPANFLAIAQVQLPDDFSALMNTSGILKGSFTLPYFKGEASAIGAYQNTQFDINTTINSSADQIHVNNLSALFVFDKATHSEAIEAVKSITTPDATIQGNGIFTLSSKQLDGKIKVHALPYHALKLAGFDLPNKLSGNLDAVLSVSGVLPLPMVYGSIHSEGKFEGEPFSLNIVGSQKDKTLIFDDTKLSWNNTLLTANGIASKEKLDLHVKLYDLKLTDFNKFGYDLKPGNIDLKFDLLGSIELPVLDGLMTLTVNNKNYPNDINAAREDIVVTTKFMTENEKLIVISNVQHGQETKGKLQVNSAYKAFLNWIVDGANAQQLSELPLDINAKGNIGLNWINNFIDRDIQSISGELSLDTLLKGTIKEPRIKGSLALNNGIYVNALSQTSIKNAQIKLAFDEKSITIIKAEANDGHKGRLNLNGNAVLADGDNGQIDITLNLKQASLVRREDIEGDTTGTIKLTGDFKELLLKGDIDVYPFQIMLDLIPTDSIPEIEVSLEEDSRKTSKTSLAAPPVALNLNINVDQQAYIRGRGLDAELKGAIVLTGTSKKPNYNGQFKIIRGTFELFSKTFRLEEGDVLFSNDAVSLFVQGRHEGKEITFIASLSGTMDDLKISLRTEPSLPEDEALARLLFGKSIRNMSPIQAIQLASAIQTLRGEIGSFDPLGKARKLLNVDNISVESQETNKGSGVSIGLGKYITEGVYIELSRTPEPSQPWKGSIEVELSPNINLETTSDNNSGFGGVELQWKNDY
jgi:translocation and assembly module TamB